MEVGALSSIKAKARHFRTELKAECEKWRKEPFVTEEWVTLSMAMADMDSVISDLE